MFKSNKDISIGEFITLATGFLLFLSFFRLSHYYNAFNIEILAYIDITEVIGLFFDKIVLSVFLVILIFGVYLATLSKGNNLDKLNGKIADYFKAKVKSKILLSLIAVLMVIINSGLFILFISLIYQLIPGKYLGKSMNDSALLLLVLSIISLNLFLSPNRFLNISKFIWLVLFSLLILGYVYVLGNQDVSMVKERKRYNVTIIFQDGKTINSDSTNYYVGKTNEYLFFYHQDSLITDIYRMENIKQLRFK
jgi:hypothetical protein